MGAKGKLGRYLFRKIGGRIVPIRINNIADKISDANNMGGLRHRKIQAIGDKGTYMGQLTLTIPKKGKTATIMDVRVPKQYQKKGISKNLFARATQFLERAKYKFLKSDEIMHPAQVKIRNKYGIRRVGGKIKNRTKFFAD